MAGMTLQEIKDLVEMEETYHNHLITKLSLITMAGIMMMGGIIIMDGMITLETKEIKVNGH